MLTKTLIIAAFALVAIMVAVLARVVAARRRGKPMPEAVLLQWPTWAVVAVVFAALAGGYAYAAGWIAGEDDLVTSPAPAPPPQPAPPPATAPPPAPTTTTTGTTPEAPPATPPAPAPAGSAGDCKPDEFLSVPLTGYALEPLTAQVLSQLQAEFPKAALVGGRALRSATGDGALAAQLVVLCAPSANVQGTQRAVLQLQEERLQQETGESVQHTTFTVGRTVVTGRRTESTGRYAGTWSGDSAVYLLRELTSEQAEPVLRVAVPRLRR